MFTNNRNKDQVGNQTSIKQDLREFDQDLDFYSETEADDNNRANVSHRNIPDFGVVKTSGKSNRLDARPDQSLPPSTGHNNKKKLIAERKDTKKEVKRKKITTKQDNRWRFFFGLGLFVIGLAGSILLVQSNTKGIEVIIATHDIVQGQKITNADLATARMSIPPDLANLLISSDELSSLITNNDNSNLSLLVASRPLRGHQPIMRGDIVSPTTLNKTGVPEGMVAMALPVSASTAASRINTGDMVTLIYVNNKDGLPGNISTIEPSSTMQADLGTTVLAEKVIVLDVARSGSNINLGSTSNSENNLAVNGNRGTITNLTLLLTIQQAQKVAVAKETGTINAVLLPFQVQTETTENNLVPGEIPQPSPYANPSPDKPITPTLTNSSSR